MTPYILGSFIVAVIVLVVLSTPQSCVLDGYQLKVRTWWLPYTFDLRKAMDLQRVSKEQLVGIKTLRLFGVGWPLRRFGWFHNPQLGLFLNLVSDPSHMWLVRFPHRKILVSPPASIEEEFAKLRADEGDQVLSRSSVAVR